MPRATSEGYERGQRIRHPMRPGDPGSESWDWEWERDPYAQTITRVYGRPMNLREIGEWMGLSHERVRQIEAKAVEKYIAGMLREGYTVDELSEMVPEWRRGSE